MHKQIVFGVVFPADVLNHSRRHRHCGHARGADERIDFTVRKFAHKFSEQNAARRSHSKSKHAEEKNFNRVQRKEIRREGFRTHDYSEQYRNYVDKLVACRFDKSRNDARFLEQIAEHQHSEQRQCRRKHYADNARNDNGKHNLFLFGYGTKLFHADFAFLFGGK